MQAGWHAWAVVLVYCIAFHRGKSRLHGIGLTRVSRDHEGFPCLAGTRRQVRMSLENELSRLHDSGGQHAASQLSALTHGYCVWVSWQGPCRTIGTLLGPLQTMLHSMNTHKMLRQLFAGDRRASGPRSSYSKK